MKTHYSGINEHFKGTIFLSDGSFLEFVSIKDGNREVNHDMSAGDYIALDDAYGESNNGRTKVVPLEHTPPGLRILEQNVLEK